jgi:hypothetical protein
VVRKNNEKRERRKRKRSNKNVDKNNKGIKSESIRHEDTNGKNASKCFYKERVTWKRKNVSKTNKRLPN